MNVGGPAIVLYSNDCIRLGSYSCEAQYKDTVLDVDDIGAGWQSMASSSRSGHTSAERLDCDQADSAKHSNRQIRTPIDQGLVRRRIEQNLSRNSRSPVIAVVS